MLIIAEFYGMFEIVSTGQRPIKSNEDHKKDIGNCETAVYNTTVVGDKIYATST